MQQQDPISNAPDDNVWREIDRLQLELDRLKGRLGQTSVGHFGAAAAAQVLRDVIRNRRLRERLFGSGLFFDPAWDILLDLYQAHLVQQRVATSELGRAAAIPPTTTLRWVDKLEQSGLVIRKPDPLDARRMFVELSKKGREAMQSYFRYEGESSNCVVRSV